MFTGWFRTINQRSCSEYYVCTNNEVAGVIGAAVMRCAPGLHVNPKTFECQNTNDAGCDVRFKYFKGFLNYFKVFKFLLDSIFAWHTTFSRIKHYI